MHKYRFILAAIPFALLACGGSDSNDPKVGPPANLLVLSGGTTQAGVVGQPVPTAPTVLVTDAANLPVPGVTVTFAITSGGGSLSSTTATTSATGTASVVWTLGNTFGAKTLTASVAGLPTVSFNATAIAPAGGILAFTMTDPAGDTLPSGGGVGPKAIDLISLRGDFKSDSLIVTATFSAPVALASAAANGLGGFVEFDIDDSPATGQASTSNFFGASANLGVEYELDYFAISPTLLPLLSPSASVPVAASVVGNTVIARIPMSALGNDDGNFSLAGVIGTNDRPTDVFPNTGQTAVRRGIGVVSTIHVGASALPPDLNSAAASASWKAMRSRAR
ncbi:MAG TPA: hypothetical protein VHM24_06040 [Gemmatimonadaceae bacterium]|nr:hypothetical protein [Gemmatimonadaceae bacterium]